MVGQKLCKILHFLKGQIPSFVLEGFDTHLPEGSELRQVGSHGSFQLLCAVDS